MQKAQRARPLLRAPRNCRCLTSTDNFCSQWTATRAFSVCRQQKADTDDRPSNQPRQSRNQKVSTQRNALDGLFRRTGTNDRPNSQRSSRPPSSPRFDAQGRHAGNVQDPQARFQRNKGDRNSNASKFSPNKKAPARDARGATGRAGQRGPVAEVDEEKEGESEEDRAKKLLKQQGKEEEIAENDRDPEFTYVDPEDKDNHIFLADHFEEEFGNDAEISGWAETMNQIDRINWRLKKTEKFMEENEVPVEDEPSTDLSKTCNDELKALDEDIIQAFHSMRTTKDKAFHPHRPKAIDVPGFYKGKVGDVGVGPGGTGNVVEEALRYLGDREGMKWTYPERIARRLIAGEFVKFRSHTERREVVQALQDVAAMKDAPKEWKKVKFMPFDQNTRKEVARRIVQGRSMGDQVQIGELVEAGKMKGPQDALNSAARLVGSHYSGNQRNTVLQTIQSLLPPDRPQQVQQGAGK